MEFIQLIIKNDIEINENGFASFARALKSYKGISEDMFNLYKTFLIRYKWHPNPDIFDAYVDNLVKDDKSAMVTQLVKNIR